MKLRTFLSAALVFILAYSYAQDIIVRGIVYDKDSITPMQFAYVVNKNTTRGIVTDEKGSFAIHIHLGDTLYFSYLGYSVTKIFTHLLSDSVKNNVLILKVFLKEKVNNLNQVVISNHAFTNDQKEFYARKENEYKRTIASMISMGPMGGGLNIDALYDTFSKKGKELKKLSELYDQLLIDEEKEKRLDPSKIRSITGNDTLNVKAFLSHYYLPDQFVLSASDYDLFFVIDRYYKQYIEERIRNQNMEGK